MRERWLSLLIVFSFGNLLSADESRYSTVVEERSYGDLHIGGLLGEPAGRQLARNVLDVLNRRDEKLSRHSLTENDLNPDRQRADTKGLDVDDLVDLLNSDARLRKYDQ